MRATKDARAESKESLATTPMIFAYGSGSLIPGFDGSSPLRDAVGNAIRSFVMMLSFLIVAVGAILPWALFGGFIFWLIRRFRPGLITRHRTHDEEAPQT